MSKLSTGIAVLLLTGCSSFARGQVIAEFPTPTPASGPLGLAFAPDGNLYFTEFDANQIGRLSPNGTIVEFPLPSSRCGPGSIAVGPAGDIWYTRGCDGGIAGHYPPPVTIVGVMSPSGTTREFLVSAIPTDIAVGPDGNLWIAGGVIARVTPTGVVSYFSPPGTGGTVGFYPIGITAGPDGNMWFTEGGSSYVGKISLAGVITEFFVPGNLTSGYISPGSDGNLWFTAANHSGNAIGRISTSGDVTLFFVGTPSIGSSRIASGSDGKLWFTEPGTGYGGSVLGKLGRIDLEGHISEFTTPTADSQPTGIAAGPDGNIWFTEFAVGRLGRVSLDQLYGCGPTDALSCRQVVLPKAGRRPASTLSPRSP